MARSCGSKSQTLTAGNPDRHANSKVFPLSKTSTMLQLLCNAIHTRRGASGSNACQTVSSECSAALVVFLPIPRVVLALVLLGARLVLRRRLIHRLMQVGARLIHGGLRRGAGRGAVQLELLERRQRTAVERRSEGGAAGVGHLGGAEVELLELRQHSSRQRRCTCRRRRHHEGGEALVAEQVAGEIESLKRGPPLQDRRKGHQPRVADVGVVGWLVMLVLLGVSGG
eukprot:scaffold118722_cov60-Phaeocystis_antarctica.AAC.3